MRCGSILAVMLAVATAGGCSGGAEPGGGLEGYYNSTWQVSTINGQPLPFTWQDVQFLPVDTSTTVLQALEIRMGTGIGTNPCGDNIGGTPSADEADCCVAEGRWSRNGGPETTWREYCLVGLMDALSGFQVWWNNFQGPLPTAKEGSVEPPSRLTLVRPADCGGPADFSCPALTMILDRQ